MHELSICAAIADVVRQHAAGREVISVQLRVGYLRQLVPDSLEFCWSLEIEKTPLSGARLEIEQVPAVIACSECGEQTVLDTPRMACASCSSALVSVVAGEECLITSIELKTPAGSEER